MADTFKVLAQSNPSAATLTDIYTVPGSTSTVVSTIVVCNRSAVATSFRISIQVANAADDNKQYLYYDVIIPGNDTFTLTLGITLATTDVIAVYATLATLSFNIFGSEIT
jgi:ribosomal protein S2